MTTLALISDTHVPSRADAIPAWVEERVRAADHTVHAGDYDSPAAFGTVRELAGENLTAIRGNVDPPTIDAPDVATVSFDGVQFVVCHGTGPSAGYRDRVAGIVREQVGDDPDRTVVGVSGHTHRLLDEWVDDVRLLNPGTATGADPGKQVSMMTAETSDGDLDVTVHTREK